MTKVLGKNGKVISYGGAIVGDANISPENIKKGVSIFGTTGTYEGSGGAAEGDITFYDYDGSIVESWSLSELQSKTALPSNPSHTGLVAQGWNWSLADLKTQNTKMNVGQMYKTSSGLTEIDITLTRVTGLTVNCLMVGNKDWGDGTTDSATSHTYANYGDYTITCDGTSIPGGSYLSGGMFGQGESNVHGYYCTAIRIGENVTRIGGYAFSFCRSIITVTIPQGVPDSGVACQFQYCISLVSVTIPTTYTDVEVGTFQYCYALASVALPKEVTRIQVGAFNTCKSLHSLPIPPTVIYFGNYVFRDAALTTAIIPQGVRTLPDDTFSGCYSLTSVTIKGASNISNQVFQNCCACKKYDFTSVTSVPTLSATSSFTGINGICKIVVPDSLYDTWIAATNWSTYANYIYKASEVE